MRIPEHVLAHPDYPLVAEYYGAAETIKIIESGIPINRPGVVPSLQVPPGEHQDCYGADGLGGLGSSVKDDGTVESTPYYEDGRVWRSPPEASPPLVRDERDVRSYVWGDVPPVTSDGYAGLPLPSQIAPNAVLEGAPEEGPSDFVMLLAAVGLTLLLAGGK